MLKHVLAAAALAATGAACLNAASHAQIVIELETLGPNSLRVAGDIVLPEQGEGPFPAVMLISGSGMQDRYASPDYFDGYGGHRDWTERLNAAGFAVVRYDEPGTGRSEGEWARSGLFDQKQAVAAIIEQARADQRIEAERFFVLGHSAGSMIAMMLSAEDPDLAGLVLVAAPAMGMWELIEYQNREQAVMSSTDPAAQAERKAELDASVLSMVRRYAEVRETTQIDTLSLARMVQSPAFILHGGGDYQVPPGNAATLAETIARAGVEAVSLVIPDVNHLLVNDPERHADYREIEDLSLDTRLTGAAIEWLSVQSRRGG